MGWKQPFFLFLMLSLNAVTEYLNSKDRKRDDDLVRNDKVYYGMSLHIDGACPAFEDTRLGQMIYPPNYFGIEYQKIFETYHFSKFPNESEDTRNYRLSQYRPYQQEPFQKVLQVITGAIFQDSNYSIEIDSKDDNDYIWGENFNGKHLVGYLADKLQNICNDPNGRFVIIPKYSRLEQTGKVEPDIWFIPSVSILFVTEDEIIFERNGLTWLVNKIGYFRYKKDEKENYILLDEGGYYAHLLNRLPVYMAGGLWNTQGFYESWLNAAKAIADEFVGEKSLSQLVNKQGAHPFFIAASEDCPHCENGQVQVCKKCGTTTDKCNCDYDTSTSTFNPNWSLATCPSCGGKGVQAHDPAKWLIVPPEEMGNDLVKIVSTDTATAKIQFENVKDVEKRIMRALHLNYIEEAQSGIAKDKDMETRYQFLSMIANSLFDHHLYNWIKDIIALRNIRVRNGQAVPDTEGKFTIVKPTQFNIETAAELLEQYKTAYEGNVPDFMLTRQLESYVDKQFGGDLVLKRKTELINQMDKIAVTPPSKVSVLLMNGGISQRDLQFHVELPLILDRLVRERGQEYIIGKDFDAIKAEVDRIFSEIAPPLLKIDETI